MSVNELAVFINWTHTLVSSCTRKYIFQTLQSNYVYLSNQMTPWVRLNWLTAFCSSLALLGFSFKWDIKMRFADRVLCSLHSLCLKVWEALCFLTSSFLHISGGLITLMGLVTFGILDTINRVSHTYHIRDFTVT